LSGVNAQVHCFKKLQSEIVAPNKEKIPDWERAHVRAQALRSSLLRCNKMAIPAGVCIILIAPYFILFAYLHSQGVATRTNS
jgi:hypothetical protein